MNTQPEALRLIQHMDEEWQEDWNGQAIRAELRRLHDVERDFQALQHALVGNSGRSAILEPERLHALNQELLEALKEALPALEAAWYNEREVRKALAAIAKATGEQE